mgnify:CR=1 FL=1
MNIFLAGDHLATQTRISIGTPGTDSGAAQPDGGEHAPDQRNARAFGARFQHRHLDPLRSSVVSIVVGAVLTSCSGFGDFDQHQASPSPSSAAAAACTLVSSGDVSVAFGQQFSAGNKASSFGEIDNECTFVGQHGIVAVEVVSGSAARHFYVGSQKKFTGWMPAPGIGDEAILASDGSGLLAIKSQIAIFVTALLNNETEADLGNGCVLVAKQVFSKVDQ